MKKKNTLIKCIAAAAAVAGIAYLVVRYFDTIHAWLCKLCPRCTLEDDFVVDEHFAPASTESFTQTVTEEAPAEPTHTETDTAPVADDADFEEE